MAIEGLQSYDDYCERFEGDGGAAAELLTERAFMEANAPRCKGCGDDLEVKFYRGTGYEYDRCRCTDTVVS